MTPMIEPSKWHRTFNRYGRPLRSSRTLDRIAEVLAGERCENCDGPGPTTKVGIRYVCEVCVAALGEAA